MRLGILNCVFFLFLFSSNLDAYYVCDFQPQAINVRVVIWQMPLTFLCDHYHSRLLKNMSFFNPFYRKNFVILSFGFDAWCVTFFLYVSYSIQYCFIKVFVKTLIVCIFYEHFVFHVYTLSRFIWCNKLTHTNVLLCHVTYFTV